MIQGKINLLFVEDEPDVREIVQAALSLDPEFAVTSFISGEDAMASIQEDGSRFDLALLDYRLPGMTGIELHRLMRCVPGMASVKTVLITASILPKDIAKYGGEIVGVISKPFHPMKLASDLRSMLSRALSSGSGGELREGPL